MSALAWILVSYLAIGAVITIWLADETRRTIEHDRDARQAIEGAAMSPRFAVVFVQVFTAVLWPIFLVMLVRNSIDHDHDDDDQAGAA